MSMSEKQTRKDLIDPALKEAGWDPIIPYNPQSHMDFSCDLAAIEEFPTNNGPVDYLLVHNNQPLAVVEGKKEGTGPQNVLGHSDTRQAPQIVLLDLMNMVCLLVIRLTVTRFGSETCAIPTAARVKSRGSTHQLHSTRCSRAIPQAH